jgi:hypothetical protein
MAFNLKPRLGAENSVVVSLGVAALIVGIYSSKIGPVSDAHATPANDGNMLAATKKAGWESTVLMVGLALLTQDPNIVILGGATIVSEELTYRHAIMSNPDTGQIDLTPQSYAPAGGQAPAPDAAPSGGYASGILEAVAG